jgi:hypothetical protein
MPRLPFAPLALVALLFAVACNEADGPRVGLPPGAEAGTYVLRTVNGRGVPAITDSSATEFGVLEADTVTLDGRGGVMRGMSLRRESTVYGTSVARQRFAESYRLNGAAIEIGFFSPCPPNALCIQNEMGTVDVRTMTLFRSGIYTKVYERVGS